MLPTAAVPACDMPWENDVCSLFSVTSDLGAACCVGQLRIDSRLGVWFQPYICALGWFCYGIWRLAEQASGTGSTFAGNSGLMSSRQVASPLIPVSRILSSIASYLIMCNRPLKNQISTEGKLQLAMS